MQKRGNDKVGNHTGTRTKTTLVLSLLLTVLCIAVALTPTVEAKSKFKVEVQICCASSDSGSVKIKVKLPDGTSTSKKVNLAKLAEAQDWDNVDVFVKLKHRYESFKVCVSGLGCHWGAADEGPVVFKGY